MTPTTRFVSRLALVLAALLPTGCELFKSPGGGGGPITVLAMGDSQTGEVNYPGVSPWPAHLQGLEPEWTIVNQGRGRETSSGGRGRLAGQLSSVKPDVVVIFYGANNVILGQEGGFLGDIQAMVDATRAAGAKAVVANILPMSGSLAGLNGGVNRLNEQLRSVSGAVLVNVNGEFSGSAATERFPDGLHPDLDGQRILAAALREAIR